MRRVRLYSVYLSLTNSESCSLAESKAQTSIVDKLSHSLYKAIWA